MTLLAEHLDQDASTIAKRIEELGGWVKRRQAKAGRLHWKIQCPHPQHPDTNPSASLSEGRDGETLMYCFGGTCKTLPSDVWFMQAIQRLRDGVAFTPASPRSDSSGGSGGGTQTAVYRYFDTEGNEYQKVRYDFGNGGKRFEWRTITGGTYISGLTKVSVEDLLPYGSELLAERPGHQVWWVEGEKDADRARSLGLIALSSPAGATGPLPDLSCLAGHPVNIIADRDEAGLFHARAVQAALEPYALTIGLYGPAPRRKKSDLSDHLDAGYGMDDLEEGVPPYVPGAQQPDEEQLAAYVEATTQTADEPADGLLPDEFWDRHEILRDIRSAAQSRMLRPEPVLVGCLVIASSCVSPQYVLPPVIGAPASLNLFALLYGASGMGKSTSLSTSRELLGVPVERWDAATWQLGARGLDVCGLYTVRLGSGEGIAHAFAERVSTTDTSGPKPKTVTRLMRVRDHALIADPEGSALAAHQSRAGATIGPVLLSAFSGEALLSAYSKRGADNAVDFDLEPLSYRLGMLLGIQPDVAGHYLEQVGVGWPQRLLWTTVHGPLPEAPEMPLERLGWKRPTDPVERVQIAVDPAIGVELRDAMRAYRESGGDPLDSHIGLLRLKVAAALHVLLNPGLEPAVTLADWAMAGIIVTASGQVRDGARRHVSDQVKARIEQQAQAKAREQVAAQRATERDAVSRVASVIARAALRHFTEDSEHWCSGSACLRRAVAGRDRPLFEYAVEHAVERGLLVACSGPEGARYQPGPDVEVSPI
jgi:hypothetical protein